MSGGEKARLVLAMIVWQRPNLLLLDEPTNHLDLATREALAMALNEFEGTVMLVSHDRALLRAVCDEFWMVGRGARRPVRRRPRRLPALPARRSQAPARTGQDRSGRRQRCGQGRRTGCRNAGSCFDSCQRKPGKRWRPKRVHIPRRQRACGARRPRPAQARRTGAPAASRKAAPAQARAGKNRPPPGRTRHRTRRARRAPHASPATGRDRRLRAPPQGQWRRNGGARRALA